jgi:hypothetical protein
MTEERFEDNVEKSSEDIVEILDAAGGMDPLPEGKKKSKKTLWIILIVVAVLIVLCVCAVLILGLVGLSSGWFEGIMQILPVESKLLALIQSTQDHTKNDALS